MTTDNVLEEVYQERLRQNDKWGEQNHPARLYLKENGSILSRKRYGQLTSAKQAKDLVETMAHFGHLTFMDVFIEEVWEAIEAESAEDLREELIQCAAVAVAMVESLDRNELKL